MGIVKIYKATNEQTGEIIKDTIDHLSKILGVSRTALYCDKDREWKALGVWKIESTKDRANDGKGPRESKLYQATNLKTGEEIAGGSIALCKQLGVVRTTFYNAYSHKRLLHGKWRIEQLGSIEKEQKHDWTWLETRNENDIDYKKVKALYESYTSGRSDYWTIPRIAEECGVSSQFIKKVLEECR